MLKLVTVDGEEVYIGKKEARGSLYLRSVMDLCDESDDPVLVCVPLVELELVVAFLHSFYICPIKSLPRPLPNKGDIRNIGLPRWVHAFLDRLPFDASLINLMEAAETMKVDMLSQVIGARIASEVLKGPSDCDALLDLVKDDEDSPCRVYSATEQRAIKDQNEWAWKFEIKDVMYEHAEEADEKEDKEIPDDCDGSAACVVSEYNPEGLRSILRDPRIRNPKRKEGDSEEDQFRLKSPYAGIIALFLP